MSLRLQLVSLIGIVLAISLAVGSALAYGYARGKVRTEMDAAIAVGDRVAHGAVADIARSADPRRQLRQIVGDYDGDRHLRAAWVGADGTVLARSRPLAPSDPAPEWLYDMLAGRPKVVVVALPPPLAGRGELRLAADAHNEVAEAWGDLLLTLVVLGLFCGLVLVLTTAMLGYALRPLRRLSTAFGRVGEGDYGERVAAAGPLELSRLCLGFNRMLERLSAMEGHNRRLQEQLATVQEEERADLARDLHDEVGPFLFAVGVDAAAIGPLLARGDTAEVASRADAIREATAHMRKHIRAMLGRLRADSLVEIGLKQAVDNLVTFWRARQPRIAFETRIADIELGEAVERAIYRVVQESVSNAVRHGHPARIGIEVGADAHGAVTATIADDGVGLPRDHKPGLGLSGMRERVAALGGSIAIGAGSAGRGVVVSARLPLPAEADEPRMALPA